MLFHLEERLYDFVIVFILKRVKKYKKTKNYFFILFFNANYSKLHSKHIDSNQKYKSTYTNERIKVVLFSF